MSVSCRKAIKITSKINYVSNSFQWVWSSEPPQKNASKQVPKNIENWPPKYWFSWRFNTPFFIKNQPLTPPRSQVHPDPQNSLKKNKNLFKNHKNRQENMSAYHRGSPLAIEYKPPFEFSFLGPGSRFAVKGYHPNMLHICSVVGWLA